MSQRKNLKAENQDSYLNARIKDNHNLFPNRLFNDEQVENILVELPPSIEELFGGNYDESPEDKTYEEDKTFWDRSNKESFKLKGMSPARKFHKNFK